MININQVDFQYPNGPPVLKNFNLHIQSQARLCIMGASGQGKTTILRLLAGLEHVSSGKIEFAGKLSISMVFQEDRLLPHKTALENTAMFSNVKAAQRILNEIGLKDWINAYPDELSGGMKRRVALARALAHPFDLLLLDEPFTGLDADTKSDCFNEINRISQGRILVMTSHDSSEAEALNAEIIEI